ncbi:uncharacterized protein LOC143286424 [Babylonia areolata]|uniref:uncharacterized protein LOC143286424 n=1 Tax=Babylonia areolata TaxID=304850 RepID=UPI003FD4A4AD
MKNIEKQCLRTLRPDLQKNVDCPRVVEMFVDCGLLTPRDKHFIISRTQDRVNQNQRLINFLLDEGTSGHFRLFMDILKSTEHDIQWQKMQTFIQNRQNPSGATTAPLVAAATGVHAGQSAQASEDLLSDFFTKIHDSQNRLLMEMKNTQQDVTEIKASQQQLCQQLGGQLQNHRKHLDEKLEEHRGQLEGQLQKHKEEVDGQLQEHHGQLRELRTTQQEHHQALDEIRTKQQQYQELLDNLAAIADTVRETLFQMEVSEVSQDVLKELEDVKQRVERLEDKEKGEEWKQETTAIRNKLRRVCVRVQDALQKHQDRIVKLEKDVEKVNDHATAKDAEIASLSERVRKMEVRERAKASFLRFESSPVTPPPLPPQSRKPLLPPITKEKATAAASHSSPYGQRMRMPTRPMLPSPPPKPKPRSRKPLQSRPSEEGRGTT